MVGLVPPLDLNIYIDKVAVCVFVAMDVNQQRYFLRGTSLPSPTG